MLLLLAPASGVSAACTALIPVNAAAIWAAKICILIDFHPFPVMDGDSSLKWTVTLSEPAQAIPKEGHTVPVASSNGLRSNMDYSGFTHCRIYYIRVTIGW
ncbi:hypothetical protein GCM10025772_18070 [Ferrimonas gelatinilytica]|uniref:Secreted protein n=1 Tax=Ferrimonas gelatinilytica TaxID=1255257 RepID=A0ABP9S666_9GAMM